MLCPSCGYECREGAAFCGMCGTALAQVLACPSCGARNVGEHGFCETCGQPLRESDRGVDLTGTLTGRPAAFVRGRYEVVRVLGEGAKKRVYLVHDRFLDRDAAFASMKTEGLTAEALIRLR